MPKLTYPGSLRLRRGRWEWRVSVGGKRYHRTFDGTKGEASGQANEEYKRLRRAHEREVDGLPGQTRMSALIDAWAGTEPKPGAEREPGEIDGQDLAEKTLAGYRQAAARFWLFFATKLNDPWVHQIRPPHIKQYVSWRKAQGVTARTIAKDRTVLHTLFAYAEIMEIRDGNPVGKVEAPKARKRVPVILSPEEYERLLTECEDPMLKLYVLCLGETGGRCESEVLWLRWENVHLDDGFLLIGRSHDTKSKKERWVPMTERLVAAMRQHFLDYRLSGSPWVFHHRRNRAKAKKLSRIGGLRRAFVAAAKRAKLDPRLHQHDLRHRRITSWLAEGKSAVLVKEAVGHADLRTTMDYTHLAREHLRRLVSDSNVGQDVGQQAPGGKKVQEAPGGFEPPLEVLQDSD